MDEGSGDTIYLQRFGLRSGEDWEAVFPPLGVLVMRPTREKQIRH